MGNNNNNNNNCNKNEIDDNVFSKINQTKTLTPKGFVVAASSLLLVAVINQTIPLLHTIPAIHLAPPSTVAATPTPPQIQHHHPAPTSPSTVAATPTPRPATTSKFF